MYPLDVLIPQAEPAHAEPGDDGAGERNVAGRGWSPVPEVPLRPPRDAYPGTLPRQHRIIARAARDTSRALRDHSRRLVQRCRTECERSLREKKLTLSWRQADRDRWRAAPAVLMEQAECGPDRSPSLAGRLIAAQEEERRRI